MNKHREITYKDCLLRCDGYNYRCKAYTSEQKGERCVYDKIISSDLDKISKGEPQYITFTGLEKMVQDGK